LKCHCKDLQTALVEAHSDTKKRVANLEAKVKSAQAHDEKHLRFQGWSYPKAFGTVRAVCGQCSDYWWLVLAAAHRGAFG
jgi:hypothetical protein